MEVVKRLFDFYNSLGIWEQVLVVAGGVAAITFVLIVGSLAMGEIAVRKREHGKKRLREAIGEVLGESFKECIEDKLVCEVSAALASGRLSMDDARMIYAHYARLGFWGLHPRKLNIVPSKLEQNLLKERLMVKFWPDRITVKRIPQNSSLNSKIAELLKGVQL